MRAGLGEPRSLLRSFADDVWSRMAEPRHLASVAIASLLGMALALAATTPQASSRLAEVAKQGALLGRAYDFLHLHDPLRSWWLSLLVAATLLSVFANLAERLMLQSEKGEGPPRPAAVTVLLMTGVSALLLPGALAAERHAGLSGQLLLREGVTVDEVPAARSAGSSPRSLGFELEALGVQSDSVKVDAGGGELDLLPGRPVRIEGRELVLLRVRRLPEADVFAVASTDERTGERVVRRVRLSESFPGVGEGRRYRLLEHDEEGWGVGPALRIAVEAAGKAGALSPLEREPFWIFADLPGFDRRNRGGDEALGLEEVIPGYEAVVSVERRPGRPFLLAGGGSLALGLLVFALISVHCRRHGRGGDEGRSG